MSNKDKNNKDNITNISGLTPKQEKFVQGVLSGMTASESYRNAYSTENMKDSTGLSLRQMVLEQLQKEALNTENNEASRIRALELLGKVSEVALFTERLETTTSNKSSDEIRLELEQKIQSMFNK
jgi:uncharacterized membrane protein